LGDYRLELGLTDGTKIVRDFSRFVGSTKGLLVRLRDQKFFARVRISGGTLEWPGGLDICPDVVQYGSRGYIERRVRAIPQHTLVL
jgi:hypothetical protein